VSNAPNTNQSSRRGRLLARVLSVKMTNANPADMAAHPAICLLNLIDKAKC
jgi:hypothetical protein